MGGRPGRAGPSSFSRGGRQRPITGPYAVLPVGRPARPALSGEAVIEVARAIWSGSVGFGLVNIPVRLWSATSPKDVRFHQFDRESGRRIHYRRVTGEEPPDSGEPWDAASKAGDREAEPIEPAAQRPRSGPQEVSGPKEREVPYEEVVKGYEVAEGQYVMVTPEELAALRPERSRVIEIQDFVSLDDIDPVYFDRTYLISPQQAAGAEKPYGLLLRAMQRSRRVGIATFVLSSKTHLAAIRPRQDALVLETLFFADEVRGTSEIGFAGPPVEPAERELDVAMKLIDLLAADWDPSRYRDAFREQVLGLIESKADRAGVIQEEEPAAPTAGVADLMAALQASVESAKKKTSAGPRTRRRRTG